MKTTSVGLSRAAVVLLILTPPVLRAADAPPPAPVTQELLSSIHVRPRLILDPFPTYAEKYLPLAMAASMESTRKGRLWTCWAGGQDMGTSPERKGPQDWGVRKELTAFLSRDDGTTWSAGLLLDERPGVSYPDIAQAPNGDIFVHRDRGGAAEILFARFREDDVQAGRRVTANAALEKLVKSRSGMKTRGGE